MRRNDGRETFGEGVNRMCNEWEQVGLKDSVCQPDGFDTYEYPSELFKLDMERLGIVAKRKTAKVINVNIKMYIFDHLRMYIFAILPLDRYIFLSDKIFL